MYSLSQTAASAQDSSAQGSVNDEASAIIVTGTRQSGITAAESAAPIKLVSDEMMSHVGQPNLNQVLAQLVPSFRTASFGSDAAQLTLSSSLRGLNPNHTLILVNGKRRHGSANLQVGSSPSQGGAAPDLDYIPAISIDHIEVLEDGAAAQYGSDAVAGVINIILKQKEGGSLSVTGGKNYSRGGLIYSGGLNYGWSNSRGYLNMTAFYRKSDGTRRGDQDLRAAGFDGNPPAGYTGAYLADILAAEDYPNVTPAYGRARSRFGVGSFNAAYELTDAIEFYGFGSTGYRNAESRAYYRTPNAVVSTGSGIYAGGVDIATYNAIAASDPSAIFARNGFVPILAFRERDSAITGGLRGEISAWRWDISTTNGHDRVRAYTKRSVNADLFVETGSRQRDFYDGAFSASEWTSNLDISHDFGSFATLAFGGEYRRNTYEIEQGEPASYYKTGASAFPGFGPEAADGHARHSRAFYADLALTPVDGLKLDGAVRHEVFSDFGKTTNWKLTGRYDFTPAIAIRGTASTGFRAPTLAEAYYTQVGVGPLSANVRLAANSAAAGLLGIEPLEPEKSTSYSAGLVLRPLPSLTVTADAYQIELRDRIVGTANILTKSVGFDADDLVWQAIVASGFGVDSSVPLVAVSSFINGPTTRTRGVDFTASYAADFQGMGRANFTLSGAYTDTKITKPTQTPAPLQAYGASIADGQSDSFLTTVTPKLKLITGVNWSLGGFSVTARETFYTKSVAYLNNGLLNRAVVDGAAITDLEIGYELNAQVQISAGAQNLFDKKPNVVELVPGGLTDGGAVVNAPLTFGPYGIDGGYWYARLDFSF
ncbi:TonB-dependent receptor [Novosphingobium sp. PC22D]|uniref:TonB-dependent receptor plug domain-containing protein n=1 Tax=Novosphingobium sp. PC22D TaxID=1962403 RepID=UPI001439E465|nr:TonB-dependent receptor [Novosphingobium sp. PC22D]